VKILFFGLVSSEKSRLLGKNAKTALPKSNAVLLDYQETDVSV